ncbi:MULTISPECIES: hypothetical protein [unclassified Vibrio]|nr:MULTISPECIES: hypothetical protein [unclassified Vibrio]MDQ2190371.1 hypothetical protein [Vibrio sp. A14(2019)]MDQ2196151.1 hypothetical protein [Vibrio sp. 2017_1457_11]NNN74983.1 hypothetical protein [Vibrio sp. B7]NNN91892.1 hypothetical protein [Vibrio sp. B8-1]NNO07192.1 hypothetical protein [Vibrio sp. B4-12]
MSDEFMPDLKGLGEECEAKHGELINLLNDIDIKSAIAAFKFESIFGSSLPIIYETLIAKIPHLESCDGRYITQSDLEEISEKIELGSFLTRFKEMSKNAKNTSEDKPSLGGLSSYAANKNFIRGEFYDVHAKDYLEALFGQFSGDLIAANGFCYNDVLDIFDFVNKTSMQKLISYQDGSKTKRDELISLFKADKKAFLKVFPKAKIKNKNQCYKMIDGALYVDFLNHATDVLFFKLGDIDAGVTGDNSNVKALLKHLTVNDLTELESTNSYNVFSKKPFICLDDSYFCVHLDMLLTAFYQVSDDCLRQGAKTQKRYNKHRAATLERKAVSLITSVLDGAEAYEEVYYDSIHTGDRCEVDGLVKFRNTLFIIEAKAHRVSPPAIEGKALRIEKHVEQIVNSAYSQCIRARESMFDVSHAPNLRDENGRAIDLDLTDVTDVILLPISQERLDEFTSNPQYVMSSGRFRPSDMPWAINIFDLYVVTDMLPQPHDFLDYIHRRIKSSDNQKMYIHDELDWLGYYLSDRLRGIENIDDEGIDLVAIEPNSDKFDDFYLKNGEKPQLYTHEFFSKLVHEMCQYENGFECAKTFCFFNKQGQKELKDMVTKQEQNLVTKRKSGSVVFSNEEQKKASIFCFYVPKHEEHELENFYTGRIDSAKEKLRGQDMSGYKLYLVKIPLMSGFSVTGVELAHTF